MMTWTNVDKSRADSAHYSVMGLINHNDGMKALRLMFPDGEADSMNVVLFSTSGVHGTYNTIEEAEACVLHGDKEQGEDVTFVIIHPRMVALRYGNCEPQTREDFAFLKKLRASSHAVLTKIGAPS
jgi:hypothetical protein